jgi:hypothetical protein
MIYPYIWLRVKRGSTRPHREAIKDVENAINDN